MAAPVRDTSSGGNQPTTANFEYDDNEWDIGIGDLIIDLDADIEKTGVGEGMAAPKPGKMHSPVEHQATVDKGLKMKIKRTKPGTKHEIVKSGENGEKHTNSAKRGSSSHRRDKKHGEKPTQKDVNGVVRCMERVVYPVTSIKDKDSQGSGLKKMKPTLGTNSAGCASGSSGNVNNGSNGNSGSNSSRNSSTSSVSNSGSNSDNSVGSNSASSGGQQQQSQTLPPSPQQQSTSPQIQVPTTTQLQPQQTQPQLSSQQSQSQGQHLQQSQPPTLQQQQPSPLQSQRSSLLIAQVSGTTLTHQPPSHSHLAPPPLLSPLLQKPQPPQLLPPPLPPQQLPSHCLPSPPTLQVQVAAQPPQISPANTPPPNILHKDLVDVCVGTSVGTITEPDCLGPCEPGTSVTLEGIVWHETEGVLVVNVTWRGKTYVGTLLDCTRHDWAPPRFCDSPTSDLDLRTPKGRGKRGRSAAHSAINDLSNFTETRSSVHSKLRSNNSAGPKGRRGPGAASPTPFATPKTDVTPGKRKTKTHEEEPPIKKKITPSQPTSPLPPPVLLECPEPNCSKKYKHINGLKYHQSHAHGSPDDDETKEYGTSEEEVQSPMPDIKKDEPTDIPPPILEEPVEIDEKPVLRFGDESNVRINSVNTSTLTTTPTPPPPIPSPPVDDSHINVANVSLQPPVLTKVQQLKVKTSPVLVPDDKKPVTSPTSSSKPQIHKKKNRKSPAGSPHPSPVEPPLLGLETGREEVQSPAYSDISDDAAPLLESEVEGKPKTTGDKKESGQSPQLQHYNMYPYYGQPPYLVPSVSEKPKETGNEKIDVSKPIEKDKKEGNSEFSQKVLSQHYYQYGYHVPGYSYNMDSYPVVIDEKKEEKPASTPEGKPLSSNTLHIPNPSKTKSETILPKEKHQNDNHQILKESIELKNQVNPAFLFQRQGQEVGRYFIYPDRKEGSSAKATPPPPLPPKAMPSPSPKHKEKQEDKKERRDDEKKQEGVKPTMETQGPPPPPTSQYTYIHPGYMQSPHYGTLPFDPSHPMYRNMNPMLVSGYPNSPYLHPQLHAVPRYAPEDLSRSQSGKALDLLQHHASQYYSHSSHKIHELQERAIKSPTPKVSAATSSPSSANGSAPVPVTSSPSVQVQAKPSGSDSKDSRSPPPQRHVHTHHHTHVGLGYPILAGQYPAPYGAAVLATEHAAAVSSVPYQAK